MERRGGGEGWALGLAVIVSLCVRDGWLILESLRMRRERWGFWDVKEKNRNGSQSQSYKVLLPKGSNYHLSTTIRLNGVVVHILTRHLAT